MTNKDLDLAREWAEFHTHTELVMDGAASRVIQALPNHWIDAEELQKIYDRYRASEINLHEAFHAAVALTTPPLPTLAELVEQGNDPQSYQWMQAQVFSTDPTLGIITGVDGYSRSAIILFTDGMAKNVPWAFITPLTDRPKLEWPGYGVEDSPVADSEPALPCPEDVPSGKPWIVKFDGHEWVGTRDSRVETVCSWALARLDGADYNVARDDEITLISRLVPEVTP